MTFCRLFCYTFARYPFGEIAQLVERRTHKPKVKGSIPFLATIFSLVKSLLMKSLFAFVVSAWVALSSIAGEHYFADSDGKGWVPIGLNICFSRYLGDDVQDALPLEERRAEFEGWLKAFAAQGGNYVRLWLGHDFFEVMPDRPGQYDMQRTETLMRVVRLCEQLGIRLKLTLESFRTVYPADQVPKRQYAKFFNRSLYAPYAKSMADFYASEDCYRIYMDKVRYLKSLGLGDSPAVFAWELWNEIEATGSMDSYAVWSDRALADLKKMFPKQKTVQNLGSYAYAGSGFAYRQMASVKDNDFMQMHRYLDAGAPMDVCRGPMDVLAAESIRELRELRGDCPLLLAETGAVKPNHTGPSILYESDKEGTLLHDGIFAPFFAGAAGCGQFWHWDSYVARWNLWWHYKRFARAVDGLDPIAEDFTPFRLETRRLRVYGLRGKTTTILWCRDKFCTWQSELVDGNAPTDVTGECLPYWGVDFTCYDPWTDVQSATKAPAIPSFKRSLVVRFPTR